MIIYILLSFTVGFEGSMFELKGNDILSSSFGASYGIFGDFYVTPNLKYGISLRKGKADASTRTMAISYDTTGQQQVFSGVRGENFEFIGGDFSVSWTPFRTVISPYVSGRLGLRNWKFVSDGDVVMSLNQNEFEGLSLSLGGGAGLRGKIAGFILDLEASSDFIFSEDRDWEEGFGSGDDNEWTVDIIFRLGKEF